MAARSPSAGRAPHTVSCSPDADTDGSPCSRRSPWRTARHWGPRRAPASHPQRRLSIASPHAPPPSILLADERTRVEAVKCHGDFAVLSSTAGCSSFSVWNSVWNSGWNSETALVRGDTPRRWGQGGVQQGEETGSASRASSALTTAAGTERTSRPVQIHSWLE